MKLLHKLALAVFVVALIFAACTTDDDVIEGAGCDMQKPLNERCIVGYTCQCPGGNPDECICTRAQNTSGLKQLDTPSDDRSPSIAEPSRVRQSASRTYLERRHPELEF